jgi:LuxR family transcriptional regulator
MAMLDDLALLNADLQRLQTLEACLARVQGAAHGLGFSALLYDYSPVPLGLDGTLISPSVFVQRDAPPDMQRIWCENGYYQRDPVQQRACLRAAPILWSYSGQARAPRSEYMGDLNPPITRYLCEHGMGTGLTVPLHLPGGAMATFTGVVGAGHDLATAAHGQGAFMLLAHAYQARAQELFDTRQRRCTQVALTQRERQCLQHSARGLTAKAIAGVLNRSVATVNLHLNSAARKLGARNRVDAVVRGLHYRLLDP